MNRKAWLDHIEEIGSDKKGRRIRLIGLTSAAIARGKHQYMYSLFEYLKETRFNRTALYETILQSYLFLGFPRMIEAGLAFQEIFGSHNADNSTDDFKRISGEESTRWYKEGIRLCRKVYGKNYDLLRDKFMQVSPEIFRWMVLEGYGKVLNRPGLNNIERELAEVAALIVDRRDRQLNSHIRGSLNVGATPSEIRRVNNDIRPLAGQVACKQAERLMERIFASHGTPR